MQVTVNQVHIEAFSTIGRAVGLDEEGREVAFAIDHRLARDLGEVIERATDDSELPVCEPADWQVLSVTV